MKQSVASKNSKYIMNMFHQTGHREQQNNPADKYLPDCATHLTYVPTDVHNHVHTTPPQYTHTTLTSQLLPALCGVHEVDVADHGGDQQRDGQDGELAGGVVAAAPIVVAAAGVHFLCDEAHIHQSKCYLSGTKRQQKLIEKLEKRDHIA
jgi:hypothetical protein